MKKPIINYLLPVLWILITLFAPAVVAQENLGRQTILQFDANHHLLRPAAPALKQSVPMEAGRSMATFVGGVGGVSFDQVATPARGLAIEQISLGYNAEKKDGQRLVITINNKPVGIFLPDWLLAPLARYAESPYYSCVTLFGDLEDDELQQQVTVHKGRVINYHPSFENTLLGIRLLYIDMLVGYPFTTDLPENSQGAYILGTGEKKPDITANERGAYYLSQHMITADNKFTEKFRSYIICDYGQKINFNINDDSLRISGFPYYYCWKFHRDCAGYDMDAKVSEISANYRDEAERQRQADGDYAVREWLTGRLILLAEKYKDAFNFYEEGTFVDLVNIPGEEERREFLMKFYTESLMQMAVNTEVYMDADSVVYLKEYSDLVSSKPELFENTNPAVWNATVQTMRYAAFFRYVKSNFPEEWLAFYGQVRELDPEPRIFTPTIMYDPDSKAVEEAIRNSQK